MLKTKSKRKGIARIKGIVRIIVAAASAVLFSAIFPTSSGIKTEEKPVQESLHKSMMPVEYIKYLEKTDPKVIAAEQEGVLKGILYDPSDEQVKEIATGLFKDRVDSENREKQLEYFVRTTAETYDECGVRQGEAMITTIPSQFSILGKAVPQYIVIGSNTLQNQSIVLDNDLANIIYHEIRHVRDVYHGIRLGNRCLTADDILGKVRTEFFQYLLELRAVHEQLKEVLMYEHTNGELNVSLAHHQHVLVKYRNYWRCLEDYPANSAEQEIRELLMQELKDIEPLDVRGREDKIKFRINLFGKEETWVLEK